jgi:hypothetical protein
VTPPRLPILLLRTLLPAPLGEIIAGDLEEEWHTLDRPSRIRFWHLAMRSIGTCRVEAARRTLTRTPREASAVAAIVTLALGSSRQP